MDRIPVIPRARLRLTGMTIHRMMTAIATEQVRLQGEQPVVGTTPQTTDDRSDAAAEQ